MFSTAADSASKIYTIELDDNARYLIYNASELGNPPDHVPNKWYFYPYNPTMIITASEPFDTAELAEQAAAAFANADPARHAS